MTAPATEMTAGTEETAAKEFLAELQSEIGQTGKPVVARYPVGPAAIGDWCDAMGDTNPCYTDADYAAASVHGDVVAPPAALDIWNRPGLPALLNRGHDDPRSRIITKLDAAGFVSTVAVTAELEIARYVRIGDLLSDVLVLEDVSPEKQTALGLGHFVTTRHRFTDEHGEHVGDLLFRILKFRPGTGRSAPAPDAGAGPDPDPALRPPPAINRDNAFLWDGFRERQLRIQSCHGCAATVFPPTPRCPQCGSFDQGYVVASGRGTLHSFAVPHYPKAPGFRYPVLVGLIQLEEGVRMLANLAGVTRDSVKIGMPLQLDWLDRGSGPESPVPLPQFLPATPVPRKDTRTSAAVGDRLPAWGLAVTPTLVVSGALATRDFTQVHHDRDIAHARGSADIFLNINTSVALLERYVQDWAGPQAVVRALRVKLGAQACPYDPMAFAGEVTSADPGTGDVTVSVNMINSNGPHLRGTVEITLPTGGTMPTGQTR
jgi:uncharacterized OB-fold protein